MIPLGWLRRLGVGGWSRLRRSRESAGGEHGAVMPPALDPAGVAVLPFPEAAPDPVCWISTPPFGRVEPVSNFLFDRQSMARSSNSSLSRDGDPAQLPDGLPWESLRSRLWRVLAPYYAPLLPGPGSVVEWPGELMAFQMDGVQALLESRRLLLADDMGLGKTLQVIAALRVLFLRGDIESALVVAPANVLDQWRRELLKWAPDLTAMVVRGSAADRGWQWATPVHVALVSYDTLRSDFSDSPASQVGRKTWDVVVADEAQRIKNRNPTSDSVKGLKRRRSWALTGTPVENDEEELASIMEFVDHEAGESPRTYVAGPALRQRHRELQLRRRKGEVLEDLPPKLVARIPVELGPAQRHSYDRAEREGIVHLRELGRDVRVQHLLELITRLKQICNADPETGESGQVRGDPRQIGNPGRQGKPGAGIFPVPAGGLRCGSGGPGPERVSPPDLHRRPVS